MAVYTNYTDYTNYTIFVSGSWISGKYFLFLPKIKSYEKEMLR